MKNDELIKGLEKINAYKTSEGIVYESLEVASEIQKDLNVFNELDVLLKGELYFDMHPIDVIKVIMENRKEIQKILE